MSVKRTPKTSNFTIMNNSHLHNRALSLKAKGLLSLMLSLPDGWSYTVSGLCTLSSDGKASTVSAMEELEKAGHLRISKPRNSNGRYTKQIFDIFEAPIRTSQGADNPPPDNPPLENPPLENPPLENPPLENPPQLNTNIENTNIENTNIENTNIENTTIENTNIENINTAYATNRSAPTIAAINDYCKLHGYVIDVRAYFNYYSARNWKNPDGTPVDWQKKIIRWATQTPDTPQGH